MVFSLLGLLAGSESLVLSRRYKVVCLINSRVEVLLVGQELSEINDVLVKKCTSDDWSMLLSVSCKNCLVNGVSDILFQFFSLIVAQLANINAFWKRELITSILVIVHLLLCSATCSHLIWYWLATCLSDSTHVLYLAALL
jgi:ABC-type multidrug transport system permease subunit